MKVERAVMVLRTRALAKITLSLRVLGTRPDGYHEIDALTVAASDPHDIIVMYRHTRPTSVSITPRHAAPTNPANNLASRAVHLVQSHLPADVVGLRISIQKRIPMGAGLGGGSADAGAVLAALERHLRIPHGAVRRAAERLGSDVKFSLRNVPVHMRGRGERLEPARHVPRLHLVVVTPPFGCATPEVYRAWDELGGPTGDRVVESDLVPGGLRNDLEPAALVVAPPLADFRDAVATAAGSGAAPLLLGSGSSYGLLVPDADEAAAVRDRVRDALGIATVWAARTRGNAAIG